MVPGARSFSFVWLRMIWRACWKRNGCFYRLSCIKHWWLDVVFVIRYNDLQICFPAQHLLLHQFHTRQFVYFSESANITAPARLWNLSDLASTILLPQRGKQYLYAGILLDGIFIPSPAVAQNELNTALQSTAFLYKHNTYTHTHIYIYISHIY